VKNSNGGRVPQSAGLKEACKKRDQVQQIARRSKLLLTGGEEEAQLKREPSHSGRDFGETEAEGKSKSKSHDPEGRTFDKKGTKGKRRGTQWRTRKTLA